MCILFVERSTSMLLIWVLRPWVLAIAIKSYFTSRDMARCSLNTTGLLASCYVPLVLQQKVPVVWRSATRAVIDSFERVLLVPMAAVSSCGPVVAINRTSGNLEPLPLLCLNYTSLACSELDRRRIEPMFKWTINQLQTRPAPHRAGENRLTLRSNPLLGDGCQ